jgi:DNA-damage-inducible protein J
MEEPRMNFTAPKLSNVSFRIDSEVKSQADRLFAELGMTMTTAFNVFLRQAIRENGIPFAITARQPNQETVAAMLEAERLAADLGAPSFATVDDLFEELEA